MGAQTRLCVVLLGLFIFVFGVMGRHWRNVLSLRAYARQSSGMESLHDSGFAHGWLPRSPNGLARNDR